MGYFYPKCDEHTLIEHISICSVCGASVVKHFEGDDPLWDSIEITNFIDDDEDWEEIL